MPPPARLFIGPRELQERVSELGRQLARDATDDLLLVTMLNGGVPFLADLVRHLSGGIAVDFLRLSPYEEGEHPPGSARIIKDLEEAVTGRDVVVVEDIVDTGLSLGFLLRNLSDREPAGLRICTLLDRAGHRLVDLPIAYRGFELGSEYLVGYGLDLLGYWRNLPCLVSIEDLDAMRGDPLTLEPLLRTWGVWAGPDHGVGRQR